MGKKRIHELAKELSMTSNELLQHMADMKIMPGVKLGASNSIEESVVTEVRKRLGSVGGRGSSPTVVKRRKKSGQAEAKARDAADRISGSEQAVPEEILTEAKESAAVGPGTKGETAGMATPPQIPVKIAPRPYEKATIVGTASSGRPGGAERLREPDFRKLDTPGEVRYELGLNKAEQPETSEFLAVPGQKAESPATAEAVSGEESASAASAEVRASEEQSYEIKVSSPVLEAGESAETAAQAETKKPGAGQETKGQAGRGARPDKGGKQERQPGEAGGKGEKRLDKPGETPSPHPRKITRELSQVGRQPGSGHPKGHFEAARVIGVKPDWTNGVRPDSPAGRSRTVSVGGLPSEEPSRRTGFKPGGARPGISPSRPGARPDILTQAPPPEHDGRKKDRKKKGGHERSDDTSGVRKRRELVERTDLYPDGAMERRNKKNKMAKKTQAKTEITVPKAIKRRIKVDEVITVSELAHRLSLKAGDIIKKLMGMGVMAGLNQSLDFDTATLVAAEFDYEVEKSSFDEGIYLPLPDISEKYQIGPRSPVVTIMGHVDHGKTSLLDYIRKTKIQEGEAGGITQHIGAYHVKVGDKYITFLDTPGHEAFTSMRSRGAQVTDIVILIVAADDGVMPQTREAADHAKAAKVPIIVAVNKIDKPGANPLKIRQQMTELGLLAGDLGGETVFVDISAKTGRGVDELLEMILLQADILALNARIDGPARGRIIEARLDRGRGAMATLLVGAGVLKLGDPYVCGAFYGKVRALYNDQGLKVEAAGPSFPVEIQGISGVPQAGDEFIVMEDEKQARQVSQHRLLKQRESELVKTSKLTLENLFDHIKAGAVKGLNLIIKADVQGSLEAILDAVSKLSTPEIKITVLHQSTGGVSETDIMLASASKALIICFGVRPAAQIQELAEREQVQVRHYNIIYKLLEDIKEAMAGLLDPVKSEKILGQADVRAIFMISKVGQVAGSYVSEGKIHRGVRARLIRDGQSVYDGRIGSLKREKSDVREVTSGHECGICLENFSDVLVGDRIEAYQIEETAATVDLINEAVERAEQARKEATR
ncbi:MAG: translation initiation factor IF-2 [Deltaproteobacteria bacterium]|jgi:translation initiation factor IF-2|nr:translation initiation factor IF-2 [Deltaproteobacteria bacterium]